MKHKGFTLVEFIVIISIFAVMASVALFNFNGFRSSVGLNNLAHDIGLTIRQAQVFGWATKSNEASGALDLTTSDPLTGNPVRFADGVYFDSGTLATQFILYRKMFARDPQHYISGVDTIVDTIKISGPYRIAGILSSNAKDDLAIVSGSMPSGAVTPLTDVSIAFTRPKPEASFFTGTTPVLSEKYVGIYVQNTGDPSSAASHVIIVSRTGEIDVQ